MSKNIKYSILSILIIVTLATGCVTYAEEINGVQNKIRRDEFKNEAREVKNNLQINIQDKKTQLEEVAQSAKSKRSEIKTEVEAIKEQAQSKIAEMKTKLKKDLKVIKNENKKNSVEKIADIIQGLNTKNTDNFSDKIDRIEKVLISIESRISKAENNGLDVSSVTPEVEKAKEAISNARNAVSTQAGKVYTVNITDESSLKPEMKSLRDTFSKDMKALHDVVKSTHTIVALTATTLAKIPKINEATNTPIQIENNNSIINN